MKVYRAKQYIILPDKESTERAKKSKTFRNNLSRILRLTCIGITAAITWTVLRPKSGFDFSDGTSNVESGIFLPIVSISVIIAAGIIIDIAILRRKKNKSQI